MDELTTCLTDASSLCSYLIHYYSIPDRCLGDKHFPSSLVCFRYGIVLSTLFHNIDTVANSAATDVVHVKFEQLRTLKLTDT